ncbi:MAG: SLBB domain-containing protein, partial [Candidatus Cloacimonetes bacterium]|nr:SLBB domain-containing protein [Candidatus Cloacimonadota bacterium]
DQYIVKMNDVFLIQTVVPDTMSLRVPVLPTGQLNLFPMADTVMVAGKTLKKAYEEINTRLNKFMKKPNVQVMLLNIAPITYTVSGAVNRSGEYTSKEPISLFQAVKLAGGLNGNAGSEISVKRAGKEITYNISKYLSEGNPAQNPQIYHQDVINAGFIKDCLRVYTNNDTLNFVESITLDGEKPVSEVIKMLSLKYKASSYDQFTLVREGKTSLIKLDESVRNNDKLIISHDEMFVYVMGSVDEPGRFAYNGGQKAIHYIALSGGFTKDASTKTCYLIDKNGVKKKYKGQPIQQGDTILVPESWRAVTAAYLVPVSTVISVISTIILLSR